MMQCQECGSTAVVENGDLVRCDNCGEVCEIMCFRGQFNEKLKRTINACTHPCMERLSSLSMPGPLCGHDMKALEAGHVKPIH